MYASRGCGTYTSTQSRGRNVKRPERQEGERCERQMHVSAYKLLSLGSLSSGYGVVTLLLFESVKSGVGRAESFSHHSVHSHPALDLYTCLTRMPD
jgi:hypothetical protein